jgi:hypothetical protein
MQIPLGTLLQADTENVVTYINSFRIKDFTEMCTT